MRWRKSNEYHLTFAENFAPEAGTIASHEEIIKEYGFVWYGKRGSSISREIKNEILNNEEPQILLIQSGKTKRYWARIIDIQNDKPENKYIPEYYRDRDDKFGTWFKIISFVEAEKDVMEKCKVTSSGTPLSIASRHSMSPYFKITYMEEA